jgi:two-component system, OmpR family, response regulator
MTKLKVLYVDDDADIREIATLCLKLDPQIDVQSESSGADALEAAKRWRPDAILLDVMMPEMDGPATLELLRHDSATAKIPVIFITARAQAGEVDQYLAMGAVAVITKPFDPMSLAATVRGQIAA